MTEPAKQTDPRSICLDQFLPHPPEKMLRIAWRGALAGISMVIGS